MSSFLFSTDEALTSYVEFTVQKISQRHTEPIRRTLCLSETCLIDRDPGTYNVCALKPLCDVSSDPLVEKWCGVTLVAIIGITILMSHMLVKTLQLIWRSGTRRWNLRVPDLQMSCRDLTLWQGTRIVVAAEWHTLLLNDITHWRRIKRNSAWHPGGPGGPYTAVLSLCISMEYLAQKMKSVGSQSWNELRWLK